MDKIILLLKSLELNDSEAKVYVELLKNGPSTGYQISKISGVARSKVYAVLENLVRKNFLICSKSENPKYYTCIPVKELISKKKDNYNSLLEEIEGELLEYDKSINMDFIWHIKGYNNIFDKCREIIKNTKKELFIQIWQDDIDEVFEGLKLLESNKIDPLVILYSAEHKYDVDLNVLYKHGFESEKLKDIPGRWVTIVSDSNEVLFGCIENNKICEVIWTQNYSMVFMAKEYVKHDAYCLKLIKSVNNSDNEELKKSVGNIRNIFEKI
ncbi:TrmB family transcriptional regulator [Clostridium sp. CF012]|uniref:TrmB family transcriptional regulator n=1 Tax=Clostridium sp. CF012 TaxID=2843319 RepID=UPI001C0B4D57|nr:helix-turn-helix domain-containing protein [Clostridium sp. CF012]MBU3145074.1 TrmB family transcriptional regulator [Clostridium sp. CF012]